MALLYISTFFISKKGRGSKKEHEHCYHGDYSPRRFPDLSFLNFAPCYCRNVILNAVCAFQVAFVDTCDLENYNLCNIKEAQNKLGLQLKCTHCEVHCTVLQWCGSLHKYVCVVTRVQDRQLVMAHTNCALQPIVRLFLSSDTTEH